MAAGLFLQPLNEVLKGIITIIREPDFLITDYIAIGGIGAAFVNAGVMAFDFHCHCLLSGDGDERPHDYLLLSNVWFFLCSERIFLNIWSIMMGVCLYAFLS